MSAALIDHVCGGAIVHPGISALSVVREGMDVDIAPAAPPAPMGMKRGAGGDDAPAAKRRWAQPAVPAPVFSFSFPQPAPVFAFPQPAMMQAGGAAFPAAAWQPHAWGNCVMPPVAA